MTNFTAEYSKRGQYGIGVCMADTIEELIQILSDRGYEFRVGEKGKILNWSHTAQKKYYSVGLNIRRGKLEMTEYTSF